MEEDKGYAKEEEVIEKTTLYYSQKVVCCLFEEGEANGTPGELCTYVK